jgi:hypothetical protein
MGTTVKSYRESVERIQIGEYGQRETRPAGPQYSKDTMIPSGCSIRPRERLLNYAVVFPVCHAGGISGTPET